MNAMEIVEAAAMESTPNAGNADAAPALITYSSTIVDGVHGNCQICWEALTQEPVSESPSSPRNRGLSTRVDTLCRAKCPAVLCLGCVQAHVTVAVDDAFPGVLPKVRCPMCLKVMNKARWEQYATPYAIDKYGWLCRAACAFRTPCCDNGEYTHLPFAIDAQEDEEAAQMRTLWLTPSAKQKLPVLRQLCRQFGNHRASAQQVVACIEEITNYGGDEVRESLYEHVLLRMLDEERRASLLLSYHHKYKLVLTRCCELEVCFNCKRRWVLNDGIHWDSTTCAEPDIDGDGIVECPSCHVTLVKVEGCDSVTCPCGEHLTIRIVDPFEERMDGGIFG